MGKHNTREKQNEYHFAGNMNHMMDLGERIALGGLASPYSTMLEIQGNYSHEKYIY